MNNELQSICSPQRHLSRRSLLRTAAGGVFFSALAQHLAAEEIAGKNTASDGRPKSVILLWMEGAPSQLETFDPHPGSMIGGDVKAIDTTTPGLRISELLPATAQQMHLSTLVRSVTSREGDHFRAQYNQRTGYRLDPTLVHPSIGAILCNQQSSNLDIPRHVTILPGEMPGRGGYLGAQYDAFKVYDPAQPVPDVRSKVDNERFDLRVKGLLDKIEPDFAAGRLRDLQRTRTLHSATTLAAKEMMSSDQLDAFDVSSESQSVRDSFGDTPFGRGCLAASRLIEVGVRCVEVTLGGWDSHVNNHELQSGRCKILDAGLAALLARLEERGLLDSTLVVCGGEFGRTPTINPAAGRDHWPHGFSTLLAGGGIQRGKVYGATSPKVIENAIAKEKKHLDRPVDVSDIQATILKALGVRYNRVIDTPVGRPMHLSQGSPIEELLV
ncbi:MAG: DUF1501 domain-containing protein [Planctomycetota bacterium]